MPRNAVIIDVRSIGPGRGLHDDEWRMTIREKRACSGEVSASSDFDSLTNVE